MPNASRLTPITSIGTPRLCCKPIAKNLCHMDIRSLYDQSKPRGCVSRPLPLPSRHAKPTRPTETMFLRATHVTIPSKPRPRSRFLGLTEHLGILQATCATLPVISAAATCRSIPACVGSASIRAEACKIRHGKPSSRSSSKVV